jgi:hypothetical protein
MVTQLVQPTPAEIAEVPMVFDQYRRHCCGFVPEDDLHILSLDLAPGDT